MRKVMTSPISSIGARLKQNMPSTSCAPSTDAMPSSKVLRSRRISLRLRTRLRLLQLKRGHLAGDGEIGVVQNECTRDAVIIELKADRIDRGLLAALFRLVIFFVEITDGHRPACQRRKLRNFRGRIVWLFFVRRDRTSNHGKRVVEFF